MRCESRFDRFSRGFGGRVLARAGDDDVVVVVVVVLVLQTWVMELAARGNAAELHVGQT